MVYADTARNCLVLQSCCVGLNLNIIVRGFNVITKEIFKVLCSNHDYYVLDMITSVITNEAESCMLSFSVCFMY